MQEAHIYSIDANHAMVNWGSWAVRNFNKGLEIESTFEHWLVSEIGDWMEGFKFGIRTIHVDTFLPLGEIGFSIVAKELLWL